MSPVLEKELREYQAEYRVPVRNRSHAVSYTLIALGVLAAAVGVYFQYAPTSWWLAHFDEGYHFASYTLGGLLLSSGLGVYADRAYDEDGDLTGRVTTAMTIMAIAVVGLVAAVVIWIL